MQGKLAREGNVFHTTKWRYLMKPNTRILHLGILPVLLAFLTGCGALGYKTEYTADLSSHEDSQTAKQYYASFDKAVELSAAVSRDLAPACSRLAEQVAAPLAPSAATDLRQEFVVQGTGKDFDIVKTAPPEALLPLSFERTKQVMAVAHAIKKTATMAFLEPAAPPGFVHNPQRTATDFSDLFDQLPEGPTPSPPADKPDTVPK